MFELEQIVDIIFLIPSFYAPQEFHFLSRIFSCKFPKQAGTSNLTLNPQIYYQVWVNNPPIK